MSDSLVTPAIHLNTEEVGFFGQIEYKFLRKYYQKRPVEHFERLPYWWEPETPGSRGLSSMDTVHKEPVVNVNFIIFGIKFETNHFNRKIRAWFVTQVHHLSNVIANLLGRKTAKI